MRVFVTGHRALLGICGLIGLIALFVSLAVPTTPTALELALAVIAFTGLGALVGSLIVGLLVGRGGVSIHYLEEKLAALTSIPAEA